MVNKEEELQNSYFEAAQKAGRTPPRAGRTAPRDFTRTVGLSTFYYLSFSGYKSNIFLSIKHILCKHISINKKYCQPFQYQPDLHMIIFPTNMFERTGNYIWLLPQITRGEVQLIFDLGNIALNNLTITRANLVLPSYSIPYL